LLLVLPLDKGAMLLCGNPWMWFGENTVCLLRISDNSQDQTFDLMGHSAGYWLCSFFCATLDGWTLPG
jgi:hypothetical protein